MQTKYDMVIQAGIAGSFSDGLQPGEVVLVREKIDSKLDIQIRLYETERNYVEYPVG